jgi:hypothetical protein
MKFYILETNSEGISLFQRGGMYYIGVPSQDGSSWTQYSKSSDRKYIEKVWKKSYKLF